MSKGKIKIKKIEVINGHLIPTHNLAMSSSLMRSENIHNFALSYHDCNTLYESKDKLLRGAEI